MVKPKFYPTGLKFVLSASVLAVMLTVPSCNEPAIKLKNKEELLSYRNAAASLVLSEEGELLGNTSWKTVPISHSVRYRNILRTPLLPRKIFVSTNIKVPIQGVSSVF